MKKCVKCGFVIENDSAKFCKKCGAKQPEIVEEIKDSKVVDSSSDDGILLNEYNDKPITDDGRQAISSDSTSEEPICSTHTDSLDTNKGNGLLWAVKTCFRKYATFKGRASRSEYWYFCLFNIIVTFILFGLAIVIKQEDISLLLLALVSIYSLVIFLPSLAANVRRLHDTGKSGWLYCLVFIPYIGAFILLFFLCKKSDSNTNLYG